MPGERGTPPVEIYPARADSIRFVVDYCHRCTEAAGGSPAYGELLGRYLRRLQSGRYWCFLASVGGQPVGYVDLEVRLHEGQEALWVGEIYVVPEHRRQGVGTALLRHALCFAHQHGGMGVYATTEPDNLGGRGILQKAGFAIVSATEEQLLLRAGAELAGRK